MEAKTNGIVVKNLIKCLEIITPVYNLSKSISDRLEENTQSLSKKDRLNRREDIIQETLMLVTYNAFIAGYIGQELAKYFAN